jgi:glucokinase
MNYLGIEIGGTKLQIVAGHGTSILARRRFAVEAKQAAEGIRQQIGTVLADLISEYQPGAVGIGFGGPVDWKTGRICRSHQIEGWSEFDLRGWVEALAQRPVCLDNDANMAALGEAWRGAGMGCNPVFYVTLGSGVGGGLVVDERIYHGATPGESEIGHVRLDRKGLTVEGACSGWSMDRRIRQLKREHSSSLLCQLVGESEGGEAKCLVRALEQGDAEARRLLKEVAENLAFGLSHVAHLFHPEVIILGGGLSLIGEPLREAVASALPAFVMEVFRGGLELRLTGLGEDAVPIGCLIAAEQSVSGSKPSAPGAQAKIPLSFRG